MKGLDPNNVLDYELGDYDEIDPPYCRDYSVTVTLNDETVIEGTVQCVWAGGGDFKPEWDTFEKN